MEKTETITRIRSISEYNDLFGIETLHPLVTVIDFSKCPLVRHHRNMFDFYVIFLKDTKCGDLIYGKQTYDYQEGTIVTLGPGQVVGSVDNGEMFQPKGYALCFHPDLIHGTSLGRHIREYTFFSYDVHEALHISERERHVIDDCLVQIKQEIEHNIDRMSKRLITKNIELFLDYCLRFYERQFITREHVNHDILTQFEHLLDNYYTSGQARREGLPSVKYCASKLRLSPNYFGDLIKKETGLTATEHIQNYLINQSKELILDPTQSIRQVAYNLGFQYPQHFTRMFKRIMGVTPNEYKKAQWTTAKLKI